MSPFNAVAAALQHETPLSRSQARGTLRLVCKELDVPAVLATREDMRRVVDHGLRDALRQRGLDYPDTLTLALQLALADSIEHEEHPAYGVFGDID